MKYAYDLDGTLADTISALRAAYQEAGTNPPLNFHLLTWREWLKDEEIHRRKNHLYITKYVKTIRPLPLANLFQHTGGTIITGASMSAAFAVTQHLFPNALVDICHSLTAAGKVAVLRRIADTGIVFDDSVDTINLIRRDSKWTAFHVPY